MDMMIEIDQIDQLIRLKSCRVIRSGFDRGARGFNEVA